MTISSMLPNILAESLFAICIIIGFGACGIGLLIPFAGTSRFWFLAAPFAGMLVVPLGALALYSVLHVPFGQAALFAAICCIIAGIAGGLTARGASDFSVNRFTVLALILCSVAIAAAALLACDYTTLSSGGPTIVYFNGTDHAGYAHLADWLNTHTVTERPDATPDQPYASWPQMMFTTDPRFGSFALLAIVSALHRTSGFFAYDVTSAIVITAEVLALAGLFTDTVFVFCLVAIGLFMAHWIDYAHTGFFGKVLSYPASLMIAGLALNSRRHVSPERVLYIMILAAAAGIMHSGPAVSLLCGCILGAAWVAQAAAERERAVLHSTAIMYGAVFFAPIIASGMLARPVVVGFPDWNLTWLSQLPRMLDLEHLYNVTGLSLRSLLILAAINILIWIALIVIAVHRRGVRATGLIAGPAILLAALFAVNARSTALQLIGFYYPASICGIGLLLSSSVSKGAFRPPLSEEFCPSLKQGLVLLLLLVCIAERIPRFIGMIDTYVRHPPPGQTFYKSEFDQLASKIGPGSIVKVDIVNPQRALAVLVEFGYRKLNVQWTPRSWQTILAYRPWPVPDYATRPTFLLGSADEQAPPGEVVWQSAMYRLLRISASG
jgi:hypothetical protein